MQCLVREAAGRLHECSGQEVLDLIESISTGRSRGCHLQDGAAGRLSFAFK
jgi:hypothetical protein